MSWNVSPSWCWTSSPTLSSTHTPTGYPSTPFHTHLQPAVSFRGILHAACTPCLCLCSASLTTGASPPSIYPVSSGCWCRATALGSASSSGPISHSLCLSTLPSPACCRLRPVCAHRASPVQLRLWTAVSHTANGCHSEAFRADASAPSQSPHVCWPTAATYSAFSESRPAWLRTPSLGLPPSVPSWHSTTSAASHSSADSETTLELFSYLQKQYLCSLASSGFTCLRSTRFRLRETCILCYYGTSAPWCHS